MLQGQILQSGPFLVLNFVDLFYIRELHLAGRLGVEDFLKYTSYLKGFQSLETKIVLPVT